jgi:hypothetical protein
LPNQKYVYDAEEFWTFLAMVDKAKSRVGIAKR